MLARLFALIVLCTAFAVSAQDRSQAASYARRAQKEAILGRVIGVTDGDTVKVLTADNQQIRVRIAFIDAPERRQAFGQRAKQAMSELAFDKEVELRPHTVDRYGRLVARVLVDGQDAGLELLKQGLCWMYEKYVIEAPLELQVSYRAAEALARSDRIGLWQDSDPVPPWQWRKHENERARMAQDAL
jgi:endonuclease YncB( thermonuclease family)